MNLERIMLVFGCIMFGAQSVGKNNNQELTKLTIIIRLLLFLIGQAASQMPDYNKAKAAIASIFELLDRVPKINNWESNEGIKLDENTLKTNINLSDIEFTYPARPDMKILKGVSLNIQQGQQVAFVGSSGCGKSTITQLIERFYDPDSGDIKLDGRDLRDYNLHWLRSQIGFVSQEPILFDLSIAENIAYGDTSREVPMDEIIEATKKANIYDFITKLPKVLYSFTLYVIFIFMNIIDY